jgi:hypothetical protein
MGSELQKAAYAAQENSPLPESVDLDGISKLITGVYLDFWGAR